MTTNRLFLLGFMGSGKSYWGRRLAGFLHLPFYDLDAYIEEKEQKEITALFLEEGRGAFSRAGAAVFARADCAGAGRDRHRRWDAVFFR